MRDVKSFPYVQEYRDNRGRMRRYFRRKGVRIALSGEPGSPEFQAAYSAVLSGGAPPIASKAAPSSIAALIASYYRSGEFKVLRPLTQKTTRHELGKIERAHGTKRVEKLARRHIKDEMSLLAADRPDAANRFLRYLRLILEHAVELGWMEVNPARGVKRLRTGGDGFLEWPEELIAQYEAHWTLGTKQRLAFDLLLYAGQRRSDTAPMARNAARKDEIRVVQQKTGAPLWIPMHPSLQASIAAAPSGGIYFLLTEYGKPFSTAGFGNWFRAQCDAAGIPEGYAAHGLRKAAGRRLADAGCSAHQIMAVLGHKSLAEAERYTRGADQRRNAQAAIGNLERGAG